VRLRQLAACQLAPANSLRSSERRLLSEGRCCYLPSRLRLAHALCVSEVFFFFKIFCLFIVTASDPPHCCAGQHHLARSHRTVRLVRARWHKVIHSDSAAAPRAGRRILEADCCAMHGRFFNARAIASTTRRSSCSRNKAAARAATASQCSGSLSG